MNRRVAAVLIMIFGPVLIGVVLGLYVYADTGRAPWQPAPTSEPVSTPRASPGAGLHDFLLVGTDNPLAG